MTPDDWNRCKAETPVREHLVGLTEDQATLKSLKWIGDWWRPIVHHIDSCMARHEQTIFPSTKWASGDEHIRLNERDGSLVAQLPIVMSLDESRVLRDGLNMVIESLEKAQSAMPMTATETVRLQPLLKSGRRSRSREA